MFHQLTMIFIYIERDQAVVVVFDVEVRVTRTCKSSGILHVPPWSYFASREGTAPASTPDTNLSAEIEIGI